MGAWNGASAHVQFINTTIELLYISGDKIIYRNNLIENHWERTLKGRQNSAASVKDLVCNVFKGGGLVLEMHFGLLSTARACQLLENTEDSWDVRNRVPA